MIQFNMSDFRKDLAIVRKATAKAKRALNGREVMTGIGEQAATIVQLRTSGGRDFQGKRFKAYTPKYEAKRRKAGRSIKPDLTISGRMLGAITSRFVTKGKSVVIFSRGEEALKASKNNRTRPFFEIVRSVEITALRKEAGRLIDKQLTRLGLA